MNSNLLNIYQGNILIVDDTPENLQILATTLTNSGYSVRGVIKSEMAIRAAQLSPPDLILLDIVMPEMDGYQVCQHLKANPQTCEIPVIFLSALDEVFDKVKAFEVGAADYITKPFQVEEVLARVKHQITIKNLQNQLQAQNEQLQQEITERTKAEAEAAAATGAKNEFFSNISHELRTPLNSILGFTQIMSCDSLLSLEQRQYLRIITRSSENLLELINSVLELSKIEAGVLELNETSFDIYRLLDSLEEIFQIKAEQKQLKLIITIASNVPQYIKTDEQKLRSCLINIVGNAIKFTNHGSVSVRVKCVAREQADNSSPLLLLFEVEDTGPGIAPVEMGTLFEAFVQTETGRKSAEGTGLGLTIARKFIQLMGGDIQVESGVGEGTTFKFKIQFRSADAKELTSQPVRKVVGLEPNQKKYKILVVDDNPESCLLLVKLLEPIGFLVRDANNGQQAIEVWESWQPDLVFIDTRMPVMDGLEATREIRAREREIPNNPPNYHTVIIAITASLFQERRGEVLAAGCDDFLGKPFQVESIFVKIAKHLGLRYRFEDVNSVNNVTFSRCTNTDESSTSFFDNEFTAMPRPWVLQLYQAANEVNEELIQNLIAEIPDNKRELAQYLTDLINDFRLDTIVNLTEKFIKNSS